MVSIEYETYRVLCKEARPQTCQGVKMTPCKYWDINHRCRANIAMVSLLNLKVIKKHNSVVIWVPNATPLGLQYSNNTLFFSIDLQVSIVGMQLGLAYELDVRLFHPEGPRLVGRRLERSHAAASGRPTLMFVLGLHLDGLCWA